MNVDIPEELVELIKNIVSSNKFDWLQHKDVQGFVVDAVKRRISELTWGPGYERQQS
ncbi:MAG: hypothetical protein QG670_1264 [Thermoproteota archaeon]|nr:hypothetical protein [Thermoproteota archaeon]